MSQPYRIEQLSSAHKRGDFSSGSEPLDTYFHAKVTQDIRRRLTACFVAVETTSGTVAGYYTLAPSSIPLPELDERTRLRLPRYPLIPAVRLGRLAIAKTHQGKGLGGALLADALMRSIRAEIAAFAMIVDAKDATAVAFYRHHGFVAFQSVADTLYLPLAEAARRLV